MNIQQVREQLSEEQKRMVSLNYRQQGLFNFYSAALHTGDTQQAQIYRDQIHEIVEMQLDSVASCSLLIRAIADAEGGSAY